MSDVQVYVVRMGHIALGPDIEEVCQLANRAQNNYEFVVDDPIDEIGIPDENGAFSIHSGFRVLRNRQHSTQHITAGIIDVPLHDDIMSAVDETNSMILVTIHSQLIESFINRARTNPRTYALFEIAAQLLTLEYRRLSNLHVDPEDCGLPWHQEIRSCVFDYCDNVDETHRKLLEPKLCTKCRAELEKSNVRQSTTDACKAMINEALKQPIWAEVNELMSDPRISFLFGGFLGGLILNWVNQSWEVILIFVLVTTFFIVRKRRKDPSIQ